MKFVVFGFYLIPLALMCGGYHMDSQVKIPYPSTKHTISLKKKSFFFFRNRRTRFAFFRWAVYQQVFAYFVTLFCTVFNVLWWLEAPVPYLALINGLMVVTGIDLFLVIIIMGYYNFFKGGTKRR